MPPSFEEQPKLRDFGKSSENTPPSKLPSGIRVLFGFSKGRSIMDIMVKNLGGGARIPMITLLGRASICQGDWKGNCFVVIGRPLVQIYYIKSLKVKDSKKDILIDLLSPDPCLDQINHWSWDGWNPIGASPFKAIGRIDK